MINKTNNTILFSAVPPVGASINIVHKADINMTSFDGPVAIPTDYVVREIQLVNTDNTISPGFVFVKGVSP